MKCKKCKTELQAGWLLCPVCGRRIVPDATEIAVPEPKRKANGYFAQQVMYQGKRYTVSAPTLEEYKQKAREIKLGILPQQEEESSFVSLCDVITAYLEKKKDKITARTMLNYESILTNVLADPAECSIDALDWQNLVDYMSTKYAGGYVRVAWALIKIAMENSGYSVPSVDLPKANKKSTILDDSEIVKLLNYVKGHKAEAGIILCLHSLRKAEAFALEVEDIYDGFIHVNKSYVVDDERQFHVENRTKTEKSTRKIPVFYDRLYEVIPPSGRILIYSPSHFVGMVRRLCQEAGVTECTPHDLRRSFASLAYSLGIPERRIMEYGGWSRPDIMYDVYVRLYTKNSQKDAEPLINYFNSTANAQETQEF